jgi:putative PIN family toxin of toxin-antitoxin system
VISAVLDANTFVSATIIPVGIPGQVLAHARARHFTLITSNAIATEALRVLTYPRIQRKYQITQADIDRLRRFLHRRAVFTPLTRQVHGVATHPEDDPILATALSAQADYLVTGDAQLLKLQTFEGTTILSPRDFLTRLAEPSGS